MKKLDWVYVFELPEIEMNYSTWKYKDVKAWIWLVNFIVCSLFIVFQYTFFLCINKFEKKIKSIGYFRASSKLTYNFIMKTRIELYLNSEIFSQKKKETRKKSGLIFNNFEIEISWKSKVFWSWFSILIFFEIMVQVSVWMFRHAKQHCMSCNFFLYRLSEML